MDLAHCHKCKHEIYDMQDTRQIITKTRVFIFHRDCYWEE